MKIYKYSVASLMLICASCSEDLNVDTPLSDDGTLTPLEVSVSLSDVASPTLTRAADKAFAKDDELLVYIEHVANNSGTVSSVDADMAPALVAFTVNSNTMVDTDENNTKKTSNLTLKSILIKGTGDEKKQENQTTLYWDDFSDSRSDATDLRTSGHGLRPKYGYCYNGGTPDENSFRPTEGELGWTIADNQTSGIKKNDLLWSKTPTSFVEYKHDKNERPGLTIPYTHAMSKVTIVLVAGDGFTGDDLESTALNVTLDDMYTNCTVKAPGQTITKNENSETIKDILMFKQSENGSVTVGETAKSTRTFEAVVVPGKEWSKGSLIAVIEGMDGNKYNIVATESVISQFLHNNKTSYLTDDKVTFASGKNYKLTITLDKQPQDIVAKITDWSDVTAEGTGEIKFAADVKTHNITETSWTEGDAFDLWRLAFEGDQEKTNTAYGDKTTTATRTGDHWVNTPPIYWANGDQKYYFRALMKHEAKSETDPSMVYKSVEGSTTASQGTDLLWATTAAHTGTEADGTTHDYAASAAINPRTGTVPMAFEHALSKITVNLETTPTPDGGVTPADAVELAGATISIANIYDQGTIALEDGKISSLDATSTIPISGFLAGNATSGEGSKLLDYVVIPQSLTKDKEGTARNGAVAFYNAGELTTLTVGGETKTYVTSTLDPIPYDAEGAKGHNARLTGAVSTSTPKPAEHYTQEEADVYNATLEGHVEAGNTRYYTYEEFKALQNFELTDDLFGLLTVAQNAQHYNTLEEYNSTLAEESPIDQTAFDALSEEQKRKLYTFDEYKALEGKSETTQDQFNQLSTDYKTKCYTLDEYKALTPAIKPFEDYEESSFNSLLALDAEKAKLQNGTHDAASAKAYNAKLTGAKKAGDEKPAVNYTQEEADAYNATLPGAVKAGDFKGYQVKSDNSSVEASPGDLKTNEANPKIVMLITLADGTTYTLDIATCTTTVEGATKNVDAWIRGEHYQYTIKLTKKDISFRAMIKEWVNKEASGNATLEWD